MVVVTGEVNTHAWVDIEAIVREAVAECGYTHPDTGFDANTVGVMSSIGRQSDDINQGVDREDVKAQGAGDQGIMFGYACDETEELMPAAIVYAHQIMARHAELLKSGAHAWMRPDAKTQVTLIYNAAGEPIAIDTVVVSMQHEASIGQDEIAAFAEEKLIKAVLPAKLLKPETKFWLTQQGAL